MIIPVSGNRLTHSHKTERKKEDTNMFKNIKKLLLENSESIAYSLSLVSGSDYTF